MLNAKKGNKKQQEEEVCWIFVNEQNVMEHKFLRLSQKKGICFLMLNNQTIAKRV